MRSTTLHKITGKQHLRKYLYTMDKIPDKLDKSEVQSLNCLPAQVARGCGRLDVVLVCFVGGGQCVSHYLLHSARLSDGAFAVSGEKERFTDYGGELRWTRVSRC